MVSILSSNLRRLFKSKLFWISLLAIGAFSFFSMSSYMHSFEYVLEYYPDEIINDATSSFLTSFPYIGLAVGIFAAFFLGTDYAFGTIRNKIIAGRRRSQIYLANLITMVLSAIITWMVTVGFSYLSAIYFTADECMQYIKPFNGLLIGLIVAIALSSLSTCVSMLVTSKAGAAVAFIGVFAAIFISAPIVSSMLSRPEYLTEPVYVPEKGRFEEVETTEKNPDYVDGFKRDLLIGFEHINPLTHIMELTSYRAEQPEDFPWMSVIDCGSFFILCTAVGMIVFGEKDLK